MINKKFTFQKKLLHISPFPIVWSNAIQRSDTFYIGGQSIQQLAYLFRKLSCWVNSSINSLMAVFVTNLWFSLLWLRRSGTRLKCGAIGLLSISVSLWLLREKSVLYIFSSFHVGVFHQLFSSYLDFSNQSHSWLLNSYSDGDSLWPLHTRGEVSSHFNEAALCILPAVESLLCHVTNMPCQANYSVFRSKKRNKPIFFSNSQDFKCFHNNHICAWVATDPFSDHICSTCHISGFSILTTYWIVFLKSMYYYIILKSLPIIFLLLRSFSDFSRFKPLSHHLML